MYKEIDMKIINNTNGKALPFFSQSLVKQDKKTMINATPAMSPMRIASVFCVSSSSSSSE